MVSGWSSKKEVYVFRSVSHGLPKIQSAARQVYPDQTWQIDNTRPSIWSAIVDTNLIQPRPRFLTQNWLDIFLGGTCIWGRRTGNVSCQTVHRHMETTHEGTIKKKITLQRFFVFLRFWTESITPCWWVPVKCSMYRKHGFCQGYSPIIKKGRFWIKLIPIYRTDHIGYLCWPLTTGLDKLGAFFCVWTVSK